MISSIHLQTALRQAGIDEEIATVNQLTGGCIHEAVEIIMASGRKVVAKINTADCAGMFEEESKSLQALRKYGAILVPEPIDVATTDENAIFLMTHLPQGKATEDTWRQFGRALAALHHVPIGKRFGFDCDNHIGATPQPNSWNDDWVVFNQQHRLGHQLQLAQNRHLLKPHELQRLHRLINNLDQYLPPRPKPALLHGDLWSGNILSSMDSSGSAVIAMIDPACSIGDGWADIAMMRLFGGFPDVCFQSYADQIDDHENVKERLTVYQLYHVLNHVNLFGRSYAGQAMALLDQLEN